MSLEGSYRNRGLLPRVAFPPPGLPCTAVPRAQAGNAGPAPEELQVMLSWAGVLGVANRDPSLLIKLLPFLQLGCLPPVQEIPPLPWPHRCTDSSLTAYDTPSLPTCAVTESCIPHARQQLEGRADICVQHDTAIPQGVWATQEIPRRHFEGNEVTSIYLT